MREGQQMEQQEYVSIKEFAELAGVSHQAIYKRLRTKSDKLRSYLKEIDDKKFISISALDLYIEVDSTSCATEVQPVETEIRNEYIEFLKSELAAKNEQITKQNEQISNLQQLLHQEQQLRLVADKKILMLETEKQEEQATESDQRKWWKFWK